MVPHPEPHHGVLVFHGQCTIMQAHSNRPEPPNLLEMQGRMLRIPPQQLVALVGETACVFWKLAIAVPESLIGAVPHRSVQRPARRSARASSASASRRPAATSSSIRRAHASASNSANHVRNAASSASESPNTASSISFTLPMNPSLLCTPTQSQTALQRPRTVGAPSPKLESRSLRFESRRQVHLLFLRIEADQIVARR